MSSMFYIIDMFNCDCCGLCCMNLRMSELYSDLDRGDGICKYFDLKSKLCSIYVNRPDKCNVDKIYDNYYKDIISREKYYELNYRACKLLKEGERKNVFSFIE